MAVTPGGRPSTTGYRVRERFAGWTLLELDLVTGRTHQIRVHLEAIGHPVAGDPMYGTGTSRRGPDGLERLFLHAWRLELTSPSSGPAHPRRGAAAGAAGAGARRAFAGAGRWREGRRRAGGEPAMPNDLAATPATTDRGRAGRACS